MKNSTSRDKQGQNELDLKNRSFLVLADSVDLRLNALLRFHFVIPVREALMCFVGG